MGILAVYLLKSAIALSIFYLFFKVLLSKETFHRFNRVVLLLVIAIALFLPLTQLQISFMPGVQSFFQEIEELGNTHRENIGNVQIEEEAIVFNESLTISSTAEEFEWVPMENEIKENQLIVFLSTLPLIHIILGIWLLGAIFRFLLFTRSLFQTISTIKTKPTFEISGHKVIILPVCRTPFSWWRYIVMSQADYDEHGEEILTHEKAHLEAYHSWDILLSEVLICIQWFNPTAYLVKQELQSIHEYEADTSVLKQGINATQYQLLLVKKAVDSSSYTLANSFNHSSLKKRITMMLKQKSKQRARIKAFAFLPLAILLVSAFARTEVNAVNIDDSPNKVTESLDVEQIPSVKDENSKSDSALFKWHFSKGNAIDSVTYIADSTTWKVSTDKDSEYITMTTTDATGLKITGTSVAVIINDTKFTKGTDGKISVEGSRKNKDTLIVKERAEKMQQLIKQIKVESKKHKNNKPLIVIDDIPQNDLDISSDFDLGTATEKDFGTLVNIDPSKIQTITVLKDTTATAHWGKKAANGAIIITTKKGSNSVIQEKISKIPPPPPLPPFLTNHKGNFLVLQTITHDGIQYHTFHTQNASTTNINTECYYGSSKKRITTVSKKLIDHILKEMGLNTLIENGDKVEFIKRNKTVEAKGMSKEEIYDFFQVSTD